MSNFNAIDGDTCGVIPLNINRYLKKSLVKKLKNKKFIAHPSDTGKIRY